jgi:hypothetical protein
MLFEVALRVSNIFVLQTHAHFQNRCSGSQLPAPASLSLPGLAC